MRVISGQAGRLKLITPATMDVRPTTDRIKETLFNIINPDIYGCRFLDLFAGSGGIGIEALSRGADAAVFVDNYKESIRCINTNLQTTKLSDRATVFTADCLGIIPRLAASGSKFDIIFMDPPYNKGYEETILSEIARTGLLAEDGYIIVEASKDTDFSYLDRLGLVLKREKSYGFNKHMFIEWSEKEE